MDSSNPGRLDRATFDRVLQRAAELQASSKDIGEGLSEEEVLALGAEVGIPASHLQQALLEERTRVDVPEADGALDRWIAPADFIAHRVVQGTSESVALALTRWLERQEHFVVQRGAGGRITFEPIQGFARGMRRLGAAFDPVRSLTYLDRTELITAVITPLEAGFCHVTLGASQRKARAAYVAGGAWVAMCGVAMGGVAVAVGQPLIGLVPIIGFGFAGNWIAKLFRKQATRGQLGLERALDELERHPALPKGARPPQLGMGAVIKGIAKEVRKALEE